MTVQPTFNACLVGSDQLALNRVSQLLATMPDHFRLVAKDADPDVALVCPGFSPSDIDRHVKAIALAKPAPDQLAALNALAKPGPVLTVPLLRYAPGLTAITPLSLARDDPATLVNIVIETDGRLQLANALTEGIAIAAQIVNDAGFVLRARTSEVIVVEGKCPVTAVDVRITARCGWRNHATMRSVSRSVRYDCAWDGDCIAGTAQVTRHDADGHRGSRAHFESGERRGLRHLYDLLAGNAAVNEVARSLDVLHQSAALLASAT